MNPTCRSATLVPLALLLAACGGETPVAPSSVETAVMPAVAVASAASRVTALDAEGCPRSPGFWCQNQGGKNPNLTPEQFAEYAALAAASLAAVEELDTPEEIAAAVCDKSDQLLRHLAALALDLAADQLTLAAALVDEDFTTVGESFDQAILVASDPLSTKGERNEIKDVIDRIISGDNLETPCGVAEEDDDEEDDGEDDGGGDF